MLRKLHVKNFRLLRDVTLTFSDAPIVLLALMIAAAVGVGCRSVGDRDALSVYPFVSADRPYEPRGPNAAGPFLRPVGGTSEGADEALFPGGKFYDRVTGAPAKRLAPTPTAAAAAWPLDHYYDLGPSSSPATRVEALGQIFRYEQEMYGAKERVSFAPLFRYINDPANRKQDLDILWPLVQYRLTPNNEQLWVLPIFYFNRFRHADGRDDLDVFILPFIFFGVERFPQDNRPADRLFWADRNRDGFLTREELPTLPAEEFARADTNNDGKISRDEAIAAFSIAEREESYFAAVPFGGTLRGFLLSDWAEFYLFPLFYHHKKGDYHSYYAPWPIVHWGHGGGRSSVHVLPFFSVDVKREQIRMPDGRVIDGDVMREAYAVLWPIIQWQNVYGTANVSDDPRRPQWERTTLMRSQMVFPFYMHVATTRRQTTSILWPFFNVERDDERDYTAIDAPWPFFRYATGIGENEFRLWPLIHNLHRIGADGSTEHRVSVLWPLIFYDRLNNTFTDEERFRFVPIFWHHVINHLQPGHPDPIATEQWTKLWPLVGYTRERDGTERIEFPSPLPMAKVEGFDDNWAIFWRLFFYERSGDGSRVRWNALGPLIRFEQDRHRVAFDFFPFVQHRSGWTQGPAPIHTSSTDLFYGLVGWGDDAHGSYLRLLWFIKIYLSTRDDVPPQLPSSPSRE